MEKLDHHRGKRVLVTGHTGFKGSWLSIWLSKLGAEVIGISLEGTDNDQVYQKTGLSRDLAADERCDIRDHERLSKLFERHRPTIVYHLAAQPIVRRSYDEPLETFSTNVMGTANVLECIRSTASVRAGVIITTDKCYKNKEQTSPYREDDELGGHDPYSCSKACAELLIDSYRKSFFQQDEKLVASVRAGNVIGGGDFSQDRLIPDCIRALMAKKDIEIRNPDSTRPWQFVLEPLYGYLLVGERLLEGKREFAEGWNFGPEQPSIVPVSKVVDLVIKGWGSGKWKCTGNPADKKHEARLLSLNIRKAKDKLHWMPKLNIEDAVRYTVDWYKKSLEPDANKPLELCHEQIKEYAAGN